MIPPGCLILADVDRFERHSQGLARAMRQLRRDLAACRGCPNAADCEILQTLHAKITRAIQQISDEWNLTELVQE